MNDIKVTHAVFIPETRDMQDDINAVLGMEGVEFIDMKPYPCHNGDNGTESFPYCIGGVWLFFKE